MKYISNVFFLSRPGFSNTYHDHDATQDVSNPFRVLGEHQTINDEIPLLHFPGRTIQIPDKLPTPFKGMSSTMDTNNHE